MNDYRNRSGSWTGYAPRTTGERWPENPRTWRNSFWQKLLLLICGH